MSTDTKSLDLRLVRVVDLEISTRSKGALGRYPGLGGYARKDITVGLVADKVTVLGLRRLRNCGETTIREILRHLKDHGLSMKRGEGEDVPIPAGLQARRSKLRDFTNIVKVLFPKDDPTPTDFIACYGLDLRFEESTFDEVARISGVSPKNLRKQICRVWARLSEAGFARDEKWLLRFMEKLREEELVRP